MRLFSERIQDRHQRWSIQNENVGSVKFIAEKLTGREYAKSQGAKVPELYHTCERIEQLPDFSEFPENFVIKPSRGWSAQNVFVLRSGLNLLDGEIWTREKIVEFITPKPMNNRPKTKIIVEEYLENWDRDYRIPLDYKFHMFGDQISFISIVERNSNVNLENNRYWFVDEDWQPLPEQIMENQIQNAEPFVIPDCADELISTAKLLGKSLGVFIRIDLYATTRGAVFGEFTPQPHGGRASKIVRRRWSSANPAWSTTSNWTALTGNPLQKNSGCSYISKLVGRKYSYNNWSGNRSRGFFKCLKANNWKKNGNYIQLDKRSGCPGGSLMMKPNIGHKVSLGLRFVDGARNFKLNGARAPSNDWNSSSVEGNGAKDTDVKLELDGNNEDALYIAVNSDGRKAGVTSSNYASVGGKKITWDKPNQTVYVKIWRTNKEITSYSQGFTEWADEWLGSLWEGKEGCG